MDFAVRVRSGVFDLQGIWEKTDNERLRSQNRK